MQRRDQSRWGHRLRHELTWLMVLKLTALTLLWWLFFSPAHRPGVDAQAASQRLGVGAEPASTDRARAGAAR